MAIIGTNLCLDRRKPLPSRKKNKMSFQRYLSLLNTSPKLLFDKFNPNRVQIKCKMCKYHLLNSYSVLGSVLKVLHILSSSIISGSIFSWGH